MVYNVEARRAAYASRMRECNYRYIDITRDGVLLFEEIKATVTEIPTAELVANGISLNYRRQDYFLNTIDVTDDFDVIYKPANGDIITINDSRYPDFTLEAEVCKFGESPLMEWVDHLRLSMRVRTKVIVN